MFARKLMTSMATLTMGLASLGFVLADDSKPSPAAMLPSPINSPQSSIQPAPRSDVPTGPLPVQQVQEHESFVTIEMVIVVMPAGFCEESGLMVDQSKPKPGEKLPKIAAILNEREAKMLKALIRINPDACVLSRPQISVPDWETGWVFVGGNFPVAADPEMSSTQGKKASIPDAAKVKYLQVGGRSFCQTQDQRGWPLSDSRYRGPSRQDAPRAYRSTGCFGGISG